MWHQWEGLETAQFLVYQPHKVHGQDEWTTFKGIQYGKGGFAGFCTVTNSLPHGDGPPAKENGSICCVPRLRELYCGAFAHADDICTIATSRDTLNRQTTIVEFFAERNALVLDAQKCKSCGCILQASPC